MGILDGATTAINAVQTAVTTGPANALSQASSALTSLFSGLGAAKLPLPNILSNYATYNYVLGIGVLTDSELNNPDETYMLGNFSQPYICKSAGSEPSQRVRTAYGKFDFFVENLVLNSTIGFEKNNNTNITGITFEIIEPYSMGMFLIACQTAAYNAGWNNYKEAPFILTIQFRGNTQQGQPQLVPNSTRYMPFRFSMLNMKVTEKGAVYHITAIPYNYTALASRTAKFKSDVSAKGATVQEVLQTGEKSLQKVINDRLQQYKDDKTVKVADQVLILFPQDISSSAAPAAQDGNKEDKSSATTSGAAAGSPDPYTKLGVSKSKINDTLIQPEATCNALGKASMGFGLDKKGDPIIGQEAKVWDAKNKVWVRGNNQPNLKYGEMRFSQDTDIINAINQVLLASNFPKETLDESKVSKEGMRDWWTIDTQVFTIPGDENLKTGSRARLIVYRVYPYQVSVGRTMPPNTPPPGVTALKKQAVKEYNYLYTGKNTEVLKFDIEFSASFAGTLAADNLKRSQDVANAAAQGAKKPEALEDGSFGMARETALYINGALEEAVEKEIGAGQAIAEVIADEKLSFRNQSLLYNALEEDVLSTVHIAIGTDIIHQHPSFDGASAGEASLKDFHNLIEEISGLGDGGVVMNIGSSVILPEVFLKAVNIARNLGYKVKDFTAANFDMIQHYRPYQNVVTRPVKSGGKGYTIIGHHEIMLPLLAQAIMEKI